MGGGADHPLNYMVLWKALNGSAEFKFGPSHLKMIMVGRKTFEHVQGFAKWCADPTKRSEPRYNFLLSKEKDKMPKVDLTRLFKDQQPLLPFKTATSGAGPSGAVDQKASLSIARSRKRVLSPSLDALSV